MRVFSTTLIIAATFSLGCGSAAPAPVAQPEPAPSVPIGSTEATPEEDDWDWIEDLPPAAKPAPKAVRRIGPQLGCILEVQPVCELGKVPWVGVAITNEGDEDVWLLGSLDGSTYGDRYPHCRVEVTDPDGQPVTFDGGWCGTKNPLREADFVRIAPGKHLDPFVAGAGFFRPHMEPRHFKKPGEYRVRFVYSMKSESIEDYAGTEPRRVTRNAKIIELFGQIPKVELTSREVRIQMVAPGQDQTVRQ